MGLGMKDIRNGIVGLVVGVPFLGFGISAAKGQDFLQGPTPYTKPVHQVAIEAEDFPNKGAWKVITDGQGNLMSDTSGFNHISGERLLHLGPANEGIAEKEIEIPNPSKYRIWVRYEYPSFCDASFELEVIQNGKTLFSQICGTPQSTRYALGLDKPKAQHDPADGAEGLVEEAFTLEGLKQGKATLRIKGKKIEATPGRAAARNIDFVWLTTDTQDEWRAHYSRVNKDYPILDAFRDGIGSRFEARVKNKGKVKTSWSASHIYNRFPWSANENNFAKDIEPDQWSNWFALPLQDTCHFHMTTFRSGAPVDFDLEIRPENNRAVTANAMKGDAELFRFSAKQIARIYLPTYPGKKENPISAEQRLNQIVKAMEAGPGMGKEPTTALTYGGWLPLGQEDEYGLLYAKLYRGLGFRSWHPALSGPKVKENLEKVGIQTGKTVTAFAHRNFPTSATIERTKLRLTNLKQNKDLLWFEFGDEIEFPEWLEAVGEEEAERMKKDSQRFTSKEGLADLWKTWLDKRRPNIPKTEYWVGDWGPFQPARLHADSSPRIAEINPRLYVDSLLFYEEVATAWAADGTRKVKAAFGQTTLCGYNQSLHPLYFPTVSRTIRWFRNGASDFARHSEAFWRTGQAGPLVNGYIAEHFRSGLSNRPGGVLRQYNMPHAPGNTDIDFLRSGYTHLAHGATVLDFYGIGLNETFGENHIDQRQLGRFKAIQELSYAMGYVEDILPDSRALSTGVALLVSGSTERWDLAGITRDRMGLDTNGVNFRKAKLHHHVDRLGIWTALNLLGSSPDIIIEEDCTPEKLKNFKVVVVVGDCLPVSLSKSLDEWVTKGGTLIATAGAGRFDPYHEAQQDFQTLLGIETRATTQTQTILRPRPDLAFAAPHDTVQGEGWKIPSFATKEQVTPVPDVTVLARLESDKSPALFARKRGLGRTYYCAFHPGIALMWKAIQPAKSPDRGVGVHSEVTGYDPACLDLFRGILGETGVLPLVESSNLLVDRRVIMGNGGEALFIPMANYSQSGDPFTMTVRTGFPIRRISSAQHGALTFEKKEDGVHFRHPGLKAGDILRLDP